MSGRIIGDSELLLKSCVTVDYPGRPGILRNASIKLGTGEIHGLAGQSGSGKTTLGLALMKLLQHRGALVHGSIELRGTDISRFSESQMRGIRGKEISLMLQNPASALNPARRIGAQFRSVWSAHRSDSAWQDAAVETLAELSLDADTKFFNLYPRQLSTGMAQRVLLALAVLHRPTLLIADEPTSSLDSLNQIDALKLLTRLRRERGMSIILISHDLLALRSVCDNVSIMFEGTVVETIRAGSLLTGSTHPHTRQLTSAVQPLVSGMIFDHGYENMHAYGQL
jgi:ABC-type dipeptide/oligopeptide/nickel transport system ATPase component